MPITILKIGGAPGPVGGGGGGGTGLRAALALASSIRLGAPL
jgi:hypothetical protein